MWNSLLLLFSTILYSLVPCLFVSFAKNHNLIQIENAEANYTKNELNTLEQFRLILSDVIGKDDDVILEDQFLLLWLKKENMNLISANNTFRKTMQWRQEYKMRTLLNEKLLEEYPELCWVGGNAYDGSPILYGRIDGDLRALILNGLGNNVTRRSSQCIESAMRKLSDIAKLTGKLTNGAIGVFDASKFNIMQHSCLRCVQTYLRMVKEAEMLWPDFIKSVVLINVPPIAKSLGELLLSVISPSRRKVIKLFGFGRPEWSTYLRGIISPSQLPFKFGGNQ